MNPQIENNFKYHPPKGDEPAKYESIRALAKSLANLIDDLCPKSREQSIAFTKLEEAVMWANAAIARNSDFANLQKPNLVPISESTVPPPVRPLRSEENAKFAAIAESLLTPTREIPAVNPGGVC